MTGNSSVSDEDEEQHSGPQHEEIDDLNNENNDNDNDDDTLELQTPSAIARSTKTSSGGSNSNNHNSSAVQVAVRVRPLLTSLESGCAQCAEVLHAGGLDNDRATMIRVGGESGPTFTFDEVFGTSTTQVQIFEHRVFPLVESCLEGYNATILAYGQTGSGKTHTVIGPSPASHPPAQDEISQGMIPRAVHALFQRLQSLKQHNLQNRDPPSGTSPPIDDSSSNNNSNRGEGSFEFTVRVQFLELYGEEIRDLLTSTASAEKLSIRDIGNDEPEVVGATSQTVESAEAALRCLTKGMLRRVTAATAMNESSSRSHAIFSFMMDQTWINEKDATGPQVRRSKFNFVDLAGSERQKRTQASGKRLKEGININQGLLVLGNVISALGDPKKRGKAFVPYRDSKLTRLLKGSLGGNHKTLMVACVSPASVNMEESLNCLRYANRAKNIQNHAVVNVDARTRLLAELKNQVQALATDLLKSQDAGGVEGKFTREALVTLANGGTPDAWSDPSSPLKTPSRLFRQESQGADLQRLRETEEELQRTTNQLKKARRENIMMEERMHVVQAERELYRLQLAAVTGETDAGREDGKEEINHIFVDRAARYEKEIDRLKEELRVARLQITEQKPSDDANTDLAILKAHRGIEADRERLAHIQKDLMTTLDDTKSPELSPEADEVSPMDSEERAEQEHLSALTLKYSNMEDEDEVMVTRDGIEASPQPESVPQTPTEDKLAAQRHAQIEADLLEINRIIESKEELISQLQSSQAKYASMKEFYEGKLNHMEQLLEQKEEERERLVIELEKLKDNNSDTAELEQQLKKQDEHIEGIKKQKRQLKDLTAVSSKNAYEIQKLQSDVKTMKEKKVSMQRELAEERKAHALEIKMLKKEVIQKDRETRKWQRAADQRKTEAERASQMAKQKMGQLGQLRAKYKDAEKTIRMLQVKRGVMAKAGLDSVIVGRKRADKGKGQSGEASCPSNQTTDVDFDAVRDYFDGKVAEVGRKESLADKVARGWEEHFQLTWQREELAKEDTEEAQEEIQALDLRVQYEEDRIRKLASRLAKRQAEGHGEEKKDADPVDSFLYSKTFQKLVSGRSPLAAAESAAKVLFGMVVRERRRIASLAKTASSLDEKLVACQRELEEKDVAFRDYAEDCKQDFANISLNHQEQILSLMSLVKDGNTSQNSAETDLDDNATTATDTSLTMDQKQRSKMLVLANERISLLEQQLHDLKSERQVSESLRLEKQELKDSLDEKTEEYEKLETRLGSLRSTLRQLRDVLSGGRSATDSPLPEAIASRTRECLSIIKEALRVSPGPLSPMARRHSCPDIFRTGSQSPRSTKTWELVRSADDGDEDEEEAPDWADEIMADLAFIAEGLIPPSLQMLPELKEETVDEEEKSFSERLLPSSSKGPQRRKLSFDTVAEDQKPVNPKASASVDANADESSPTEISKSSSASPTRSSKNGPVEVQPSPRRNAQVTPSGIPDRNNSLDSTHSTPPRGSADSGKGKAAKDPVDRSVFDRLVSPTSFTGTQKGKHSAQHQRAAPTRDKQLPQNAGQQQMTTSKADEIASSTGTQKGRNSSQHQKAAPTRDKQIPQNAGQQQITSKADEIAGRMLDNLLRNDDDRFYTHVSEPSSKINQYTQQNVFERLSLTTTQSFAVKHVPESGQEGTSSHPPEKQKQAPHHTHSFKSEEGSSTPSPYGQSPPRTRGRTSNEKNVRSKSPTKLQPKPNDKSHERDKREKKEDYTKQNVFDRLTRTSTEAYNHRKKST